VLTDAYWAFRFIDDFNRIASMNPDGYTKTFWLAMQVVSRVMLIRVVKSLHIHWLSQHPSCFACAPHKTQ
jgi:hypothetical protein